MYVNIMKVGCIKEYFVESVNKRKEKKNNVYLNIWENISFKGI